MELNTTLPRSIGCALVGPVCFALMHRSGSAPTDTSEAEVLRVEVAALRAEVTRLQAQGVPDADAEADREVS